jgi:Uncharacterized protein conserved in bacteria
VTGRSLARSAAAALGLLVALGGLTACEPLDGLPPEGGPVVQQPVGDEADPAGTARAQLDTLSVAEWAPMTGYSRERFHHWQSQGNSCDTRDRVLQRDGQGVVTGDDCRITAGTWFSVYDGQTLTDPSDVDIDHMVPLANAWRTGAAEWTDDQRAEFANDLQRPQLLAVSSSSNRSKGDQDPSQWKPPRREYWCTYAQSWIEVKAYWRLSVTADEKAALAEMLGTCA